MKVLGWSVGIFFGMVILIAIFASLGSQPTSSGSSGRSSLSHDPTSTDTAGAAGSGASDSDSAKWMYDQTEDKMRNQITQYANLQSDNRLHFRFPYAGGSVGMLTLRKGPRGKDVLLRVDKGQFLCTSFNGCPISVKFDNAPVAKFFAIEPSDGTSNVVFIEGYSRFVERLRRSKKVIIEAEFYQEGYQQIEFSPAGLDF